jgi:hypothetical protein
MTDTSDDIVTIGPGCFAAADRSVINWEGVNYVPQPQLDVFVLDKSMKIDLSQEYANLVAQTRGDVAEENSEPEKSDVDQVLGFDVNEFESSTVFAVFNDPEAEDIKNLPDELRPQLTDVPLYEDESEVRAVQHAKLMNDDRKLMAPGRSYVIVKRQTELKTPWTVHWRGEY